MSPLAAWLLALQGDPPTVEVVRSKPWTVSVALYLPILAILAASIALGVVAGRDMHRRGRSGPGYALLVILSPPLGLVVWLVARAKYPPVDRT